MAFSAKSGGFYSLIGPIAHVCRVSGANEARLLAISGVNGTKSRRSVALPIEAITRGADERVPSFAELAEMIRGSRPQLMLSWTSVQHSDAFKLA